MPVLDGEKELTFHRINYPLPGWKNSYLWSTNENSERGGVPLYDKVRVGYSLGRRNFQGRHFSDTTMK